MTRAAGRPLRNAVPANLSERCHGLRDFNQRGHGQGTIPPATMRNRRRHGSVLKLSRQPDWGQTGIPNRLGVYTTCSLTLHYSGDARPWGVPKRYYLNRPDLAQAVADELRTCQDGKSRQRLLAASGQMTTAVFRLEERAQDGRFGRPAGVSAWWRGPALKELRAGLPSGRWKKLSTGCERLQPAPPLTSRVISAALDHQAGPTASEFQPSRLPLRVFVAQVPVNLAD